MNLENMTFYWMFRSYFVQIFMFSAQTLSLPQATAMFAARGRTSWFFLTCPSCWDKHVQPDVIFPGQSGRLLWDRTNPRTLQRVDATAQPDPSFLVQQPYRQAWLKAGRVNHGWWNFILFLNDKNSSQSGVFLSGVCN